MSDSGDRARALVLAGTISSTSDYEPFVYRDVPAVYRMIPALQTPLDLDAPRFVYARVDGKLVPVRERYGRRHCSASHPHHRR